MIDTLRYVNKNFNNATILQIVQISLIDEKLDSQNNNKNVILFHVYFGKLLTYNILIIF